MLILNQDDLLKAASFKDYIDSIEEALLLFDKNEFLMPDRMHIGYKENTLLLMPSFIEGYFGTKLVSVFPNNKNLNKPAIYGSVILNDGETGEPIALMNGGKLTALRTAAVGSIGVRYLSDINTTKLGIIGCGIQGIHQALFACSERNIDTVYAFDMLSKNIDKLRSEVNNIYPKVKVIEAKDSSELVQKSEIIILATTSEKPVIENNPETLLGKTIIGVGSYKPSMQEIPEAVFRLVDTCYVDTLFAKEETGDVANPLRKNWISDDQVKPVSDLITKKSFPKVKPDYLNQLEWHYLI